ncbi:MAG TPA: hypothetical protein ENO08_06035 [Candidatus Eisenbacteria bacterium]|uniref:Uncharacterized protein n=1 Tax=Eiseniibacteriota bacterium TaxID=2212470 RepID=A0A7V2AVJ2_UNCEI|nr:hypothetical protein [Candidatus Eisenbacteria bacterium]
MDDARDLIHKTVLVKLSNNGEFVFAGVPEEGPFFCRVEAVDEIGVWVENRNFITIEIKDSRGRYVPKEKQEAKKQAVNVLLPWKSITCIVLFAGSEGEAAAKRIVEEAGPGDSRIGFVK